MQFEVDPMHLTQKNGQKPNFWLFGSFKKAFLWFLNDPAMGIWEATCQDRLAKWKYATSSRSDERNSRKWLKTLFWLFGSFKMAFFVGFEWSSMGDTMANSYTRLISIKICNIKSMQCTKLKKMAKNLVFGYLDHSKRHFFEFWMIQHGWYDGQLIHII